MRETPEFSGMPRERLEELLCSASEFRPDFHLKIVRSGAGWKTLNHMDGWTFLLVGEWINTADEGEHQAAEFEFTTLWSAWQAGKRLRLKH